MTTHRAARDGLTVMMIAMTVWVWMLMFHSVVNEQNVAVVHDFTTLRMADSVTTSLKVKVGDCSMPSLVRGPQHSVTVAPLESGWCHVVIQVDADVMRELAAP